MYKTGTSKTKKKAAPKGYHKMPNGKLMKGTTHKSPKKKKQLAKGKKTSQQPKKVKKKLGRKR